MPTSLSIPDRPPRPVPWIWSQVALAHNTLVVLSEILYLRQLLMDTVLLLELSYRFGGGDTKQQQTLGIGDIER
jgi:hypothetical protein